MKIAPIIHEIKKLKKKGSDIDYSLFIPVSIMIIICLAVFKELNIPSPDVNLMCGGGGQSEQTAKLWTFEKFLKKILNPH